MLRSWFSCIGVIPIIVSSWCRMRCFWNCSMHKSSNLHQISSTSRETRMHASRGFTPYPVCSCLLPHLLQQQPVNAAMAWDYRPPEHTLVTKFSICASLRPDVKRFLQERRIELPDYSISQLVQAGIVDESTSRSAPPVPKLNSWNGQAGNQDRKWCLLHGTRILTVARLKIRKLAASGRNVFALRNIS